MVVSARVIEGVAVEGVAVEGFFRMEDPRRYYSPDGSVETDGFPLLLRASSAR